MGLGGDDRDTEIERGGEGGGGRESTRGRDNQT